MSKWSTPYFKKVKCLNQIYAKEEPILKVYVSHNVSRLKCKFQNIAFLLDGIQI